jgi:hypothetical protein
MAITDINISEQLQTDAPSIKYTGNEGPQNPQQQQQEMQIAQEIWEGLDPEQQGQFQSFEQFFQSGIWKQILQQMQADQGQGPETQQGIGSLGPGPMEQMPTRMGAEYGGRIGLYQGGGPHGDTELMKMVQFFMSEFGMSEEQALKQATSRSEGKFPRPEIRPSNYQEPLRPRSLLGMRPPEQVEDIREEQIGIESLRGGV